MAAVQTGPLTGASAANEKLDATYPSCKSCSSCPKNKSPGRPANHPAVGYPHSSAGSLASPAPGDAMRRIQFIEIEDQPWCPAVLRDAATDYLQHVLNLGQNYAPAAPRLRKLLEETGCRSIVDLCSGGSGPWPTLTAQVAQGPLETIEIRLTDRFPNLAAFEQASRVTGGRLKWSVEPVDATQVPDELSGVRTLFSAFHHFAPQAAVALLADAVRKRQPIAIFEGIYRSPLAVFLTSLMPLFVLALTPAIRPFRWSRLFWTYVIPLVPLLVQFDGVVSCLRAYRPEELLELTRQLGDVGYEWEAAIEGKGPIPLTYLIGRPVS